MRAILFDLDGTLLEIDIEAFLPVYFAALAPIVAELALSSPDKAIDAVLASTEAMMEPHPGRTNKQAFDARFREITNVDLERDGAVIDDFYSHVFPRLGAGLQPVRGARTAVEAALAREFVVAVATNPIFPGAAIRERIRWAGLEDVPFSLVTTYEKMHACKPDPAYYAEIADILGVVPSECLMVGDDPVLDMSAADVGMKTFFVGDGPADADWVGTLDELTRLLRELC